MFKSKRFYILIASALAMPSLMTVMMVMMVSMITPLESTALHGFGCLAGGILFSVGLGVFSNKILNKTRLV